MENKLVEWERSDTDHWDDRGHYTKPTDEYACCWTMALNIMDAAIASAECLEPVLYDEAEDIYGLIGGVFLTCLSDHADECGVQFDFIFDNEDELFTFMDSMIDLVVDVCQRSWNGAKVHEVLVDTLPNFFRK
jgi:hypothetical protein